MEKEIRNKIPKPKVKHIKILEVKDISLPHTYCITPKHLKFNDSMYLDIEEAERKSKELYPNDSRKWAVCDICKKLGKILSYNEHKKSTTLFLQVPLTDNLNDVVGLNDYLCEIKPILETLKIEGIAFKQVKI